jgi:glycosyltransferase involved in cell wall biosynthesis
MADKLDVLNVRDNRNKHPLVSIVVPVFNAEQYLPECMDSLIGQTYHDIEIICVNDGSTDPSAKILEKYAASDARVIVLTQENKGPGEARNLAMDNSHGKYILFCDADDSLEPEAAEVCVAIMEDKACDMVMFNTHIIEDGRSVPGLKNAAGEYITLIKSDDEGSLNRIESIKRMHIATVWGKMFRAALIERHNIRFSRHTIGEDARFLLSYLMILESSYALNRFLSNYYLRQKELFHAKHPWLGRLFRFPGIFIDLLKFVVRNGKPFRIFYFFLWLLVFFESRKSRA